MATFLERLGDRELAVGVVGLGYVGLPLAISFAESGFRTSASTSTSSG